MEAENLSLADGAVISSSTYTSGTGGTIIIRADESLTISGTTTSGAGSGIYVETGSEGDAGDIGLQVSQLELIDGAVISSASEAKENGGNAGTIVIAKTVEIERDEDGTIINIEPVEPADTVRLENSQIITKGESSGGGKIRIAAKDSVYLLNSQIDTDVAKGEDKGGDVSIGNPDAKTGPESVILNHSNITANADKGDGGAIFIITDNYIKSSDSELSASSDRGNDGTIKIEAPDLDITGAMTVLQGNPLDATKWMQTPCAKRSGEKVSRFVMGIRDGVPTAPDDWQPSPPTVLEPRKLKLEIRKMIEDGEEFYKKGDFVNAIRTWETVGVQGYLALRLADAYQKTGHYRKGLEVLDSALADAEKKKDSYRKALIFSMLGDILLCLGETAQTETYLEKASEHAALPKEPIVMASILNNKGNLLASQEKYADALKEYTEALGKIGKSEDAGGLKSAVLLNICRLRAKTGEYEDILTDVRNAFNQIRIMTDSHEKVAKLVSLGMLIRDIRKAQLCTPESEVALREPSPESEVALRDIAFKVLNRAKQMAKESGDVQMAAYACGALGELYESEARYDDALRLTRQAIFYAQQEYAPEILYMWQWQLGRLSDKQGNIGNAVRAYDSAVSTLTPIRGEFFTGYRDKKEIFYEKIKPVYAELAGLLLKQAETPGISESPELCEEKLRQARDTMELLKTAELQDFFQDECVTELQKKITKLDRAPEHTAILYPILLPDSLSLLLTLPNGMRHISVPINSELLTKSVREFQRQLQTRGTYAYKTYAVRLYDQLIRPFIRELETRNIDTLIVAPDSILRLIPFAALHDGNRFLAEKYAVVTVPAVTLTETAPSEQKKMTLLAAGLSEPRHGFSPLPYVPKELENIGNIAEARTFLDKTYIVANLTGEFEAHEYPVVHIATHGVFGGSAKETFLLTYDDRLTMDRLEQMIHIGRFREQPVELLTLSACQTALGDERAALGLAGIAVKAGARSALATLWFVNDESTYLAVSEFYRQLKIPGISKAKALQNAQKKLIADSRFRHPYHWAPFLLIGNWM